MTKRIGILTGGGDCPGLNTVIATAVKLGVSEGHRFFGFERGWEGVLDMSYRELDADNVKGISHLGGTILRTTNKGRFAAKVGEGKSNDIPEEILREAKDNLDKLEIDGLIVVGGDGTLAGARQLAEHGVDIVGVPKTIDNDIAATDKTFGFSSAVEVAVDALDKIHTTATSHERTFIVECMGRGSGWITLAAGIAGGANAILIPEFDFSTKDLVEFIRTRQENRHRSTIIVIAEGARVDGQTVFSRMGKDSEVHYTGVSEVLMDEIKNISGSDIEIRNAVLGHTQRGCNPNAEDRTLAKRYAAAALDVFLTGNFNQMVCLQNNVMTTCPLSEAISKIKTVSRESYEYQIAQRLGLFMH